MTEQNTAAASTSNAATADKWVNRFGVLKDVSKGQTRGGKPMVRATIVGTNSQGKSFDVSVVAYGDKVMAAILAAGNGAKINLRGTVESYEKPMDGGKYTQRTSVFKAIMVNEPKAKGAATASDAGAASDETASTTMRKIEDEEIPF
jgi:hypothetical protein